MKEGYSNNEIASFCLPRMHPFFFIPASVAIGILLQMITLKNLCHLPNQQEKIKSISILQDQLYSNIQEYTEP